MNALRAGRVLNRMSTKIAGDLGIEDRERRLIFRVDNGKGNLCPPDDAKWVKLESVFLPNGDYIQAAHRWKYPDAFAGITTTLMHDIRHAVGEKDYRADAQSPQWVGHLLAERLHLKATAKDATRRYPRSRRRTASGRSGPINAPVPVFLFFYRNGKSFHDATSRCQRRHSADAAPKGANCLISVGANPCDAVLSCIPRT
jgi:hypothetical protein